MGKEYGPFKKDKGTSAKIKGLLIEQRGVNLNETARVAFAPFAELEPRERISGPEIKRRIGAIKNTGYSVNRGYWSLPVNRAWQYLLKIRGELVDLGHGPER